MKTFAIAVPHFQRSNLRIQEHYLRSLNISKVLLAPFRYYFEKSRRPWKAWVVEAEQKAKRFGVSATSSRQKRTPARRQLLSEFLSTTANSREHTTLVRGQY